MSCFADKVCLTPNFPELVLGGLALSRFSGLVLHRENMMQKLYSECTRVMLQIQSSIKMSQEAEGHGTFKEDPKLSGKPLESGRPKEIKVSPPPPEDQSISHLVKDVKRSQYEVRKIRKDQE